MKSVEYGLTLKRDRALKSSTSVSTGHAFSIQVRSNTKSHIMFQEDLPEIILTLSLYYYFQDEVKRAEAACLTVADEINYLQRNMNDDTTETVSIGSREGIVSNQLVP